MCQSSPGGYRGADSVGTLAQAGSTIPHDCARYPAGTHIALRLRMAAVQMRVGEDVGVQEERVTQLGKDQASLGPAGPILRAAGLGFALGLIAMAVLTLVNG